MDKMNGDDFEDLGTDY